MEFTMPSLEQAGLPILIVGALVTLVGILWFLKSAFKAGFFWGLLLILGHAISIGAMLWLLQQDFSAPVYLGVLALGLLPYLLLVARHRQRTWKPTVMILIGLGILASPFAINWVDQAFFPEGPRIRDVGGETHVTLTGLADYDYATLADKTDIQVLQMANSDVTDDTLEHLKKLHRLKELDLDNTQITDAGLAHLARLPALETLRLRNTKITDAGFKEHLFKLERLVNLDVRETGVASKTLRDWKKENNERKYLK
jgi:hypothetical protein